MDPPGALQHHRQVARGCHQGAVPRDAQNLLAERFNMQVHHDTKEMPLFELVVANNGPRLNDAKPDLSEDKGPPPPGPHRPFDGKGFPSLPPGNQSAMALTAVKGGLAGSKRGHGDTAAEIAAFLASQLRMPGKDIAGLNGKYDYMLQWIVPREDASTDAQADGPSSQQQLGP
jgi:uncharacterized protein (TIGR03435 family)